MINHQQRAVRVVQHSVSRRSDDLFQVLTIAGADDEQLHQSAILSHVVQNAAVHGRVLDPDVRIASRPRGKSTVQVGTHPAIIVRGYALITGGANPVLSTGDRPQRRAAQACFLDRDPQQRAVVGRSVGVDDNPVRLPGGPIAVAADDSHRAVRRYRDGRSGGAHPPRLKVVGADRADTHHGRRRRSTNQRRDRPLLGDFDLDLDWLAGGLDGRERVTNRVLCNSELASSRSGRTGSVSLGSIAYSSRNGMSRLTASSTAHSAA